MADQPASHSQDPPSSESTRQLLDDLDALMQRMLALPVQQNEGEGEGEGEGDPTGPAAKPPAAPAQTPRGASLMPVPTSTVTVQPPLADKPAQYVVTRESAPARPAPAEPVRPPRKQDLPEPESAPTYLPVGAEPLLPILLQRPKGKPEKPGGPLVLPLQAAGKNAPPPEPLPAPRPLWMKTPPAPPPPTVAPEPGRITQMLIDINRAFDRGTNRLGAAGRWLRGEQGRAVLGWSGIAMLAAALIWAAMLFLS